MNPFAESPGRATQMFWERERLLRELAASAAAIFASETTVPAEELPSTLASWVGPDQSRRYVYAHHEWQPEHLWAVDLAGAVDFLDDQFSIQPLLAELEVFRASSPAHPLPEVDALIARIVAAGAALGEEAQAALHTYLDVRLRVLGGDAVTLTDAYSKLLATLPETPQVLAERAFLECFSTALPEGEQDRRAIDLLGAALELPDAPPWVWARLWTVAPEVAGRHDAHQLRWSKESVLLALAGLQHGSVELHPLEDLSDEIDQVHASDGRTRLRRELERVVSPDAPVSLGAPHPYAGSIIGLWPHEIWRLEPEARESIATALVPTAAAALRSIAHRSTPPTQLGFYTLALRIVLQRAEALGNPRILGILSAALASTLEAPETLWEHYGPLFMLDTLEDETEPLVDAAEKVTGEGFFALTSDDQGSGLALTRRNAHEESEQLWVRAAACLAVTGDAALLIGDSAPRRIREALAGLPGDMFTRGGGAMSSIDFEVRLRALQSDLAAQIRELSERVVPAAPATRGRELLGRALANGGADLIRRAPWLPGFFGRLDARLIERPELETSRPFELTAACRDRAAAVDQLIQTLFGDVLLTVQIRDERTKTVSAGELARHLQEATWQTALPARLARAIEQAFPSAPARTKAGNLLGQFAEARRRPVHRPEGTGESDIRFFVPELAPPDGGANVFDLLDVLGTALGRNEDRHPADVRPSSPLGADCTPGEA